MSTTCAQCSRRPEASVAQNETLSLLAASCGGRCGRFPLLHQIVVHTRRVHRRRVDLVFQEIQVCDSELRPPRQQQRQQRRRRALVSKVAIISFVLTSCAARISRASASGYSTNRSACARKGARDDKNETRRQQAQTHAETEDDARNMLQRCVGVERLSQFVLHCERFVRILRRESAHGGDGGGARRVSKRIASDHRDAPVCFRAERWRRARARAQATWRETFASAPQTAARGTGTCCDARSSANGVECAR